MGTDFFREIPRQRPLFQAILSYEDHSEVTELMHGSMDFLAHVVPLPSSILTNPSFGSLQSTECIHEYTAAYT